MKDEITTEKLIACAKAASKEAVQKAKAAGIPYTVQEGKRIVRHNPDGSKDIIGTLPKAYVRFAKKFYQIA